MVNDFKKKFPLKIESVNYDGNILILSGTGWNFSTLSAWRVCTLKKVLFACFDSEMEMEIEKICGLEIIGLLIQSNLLSIDPVFCLSDGIFLEVFSTDTYEPWVLHTDQTGSYVPTPAEPEAFENG